MGETGLIRLSRRSVLAMLSTLRELAAANSRYMLRHSASVTPCPEPRAAAWSVHHRGDRL